MLRKIVTINSIPSGLTSNGGLERRSTASVEDRVIVARHNDIVRQLQQETTKVGSSRVMITLPNREVSRLQSELARQAPDTNELPSNALEAKFGTGLRGGDWWGWLRSTMEWVDREDAHPIIRPENASPTDLTPDFGDRFRIALIGDWGTGLYGAPEIASQIQARGPFDMILHLGDTYYSGTADEMQERLIDPWPKSSAQISRTLNGNHEMYSGGYGYFDLALKAFKQPSSYFAYQNAHWLLVSLDSAFVDHDIDTQQSGWLRAVVSGAGRRKIILFSHHQLFSRLDQQGPKLKMALSALLADKMIRAWYWGHEHQCVLYDTHPEYGLLCRCLGNGGIPEPRVSLVLNAPIERSIGNVAWKRMSSTADSPACLALDGPNPFVKGEEEKFGPHGFMTLQIQGPSLIEQVFLADGTLLYENSIS